MQDATHALRAVPLFAAVPEEDLARLAASTTPRRLARGQVLFSEQDASEHLYVVAAGRLKVLVTSPRGDELVLAVLGPGDALGELSVLDGARRSATAVALEDAALWCVPAAALREQLARSPGVALAVAGVLASQVRRLTGAAADLVFLDLPRRLAKLLVTDEPSQPRRSSLVQSDVAAQLGVTRQSLNRALHGLQDRGWIEVRRSEVVVLDRPALERFAQS